MGRIANTSPGRKFLCLLSITETRSAAAAKVKTSPPNSGRKRHGGRRFRTSPALRSVLSMASHTWKTSVALWICWQQQNHRSRRGGARGVGVLGNPSYSFAVVVKVPTIVLLVVRRRIGNLIRELVVNNHGWVYIRAPGVAPKMYFNHTPMKLTRDEIPWSTAGSKLFRKQRKSFLIGVCTYRMMFTVHHRSMTYVRGGKKTFSNRKGMKRAAFSAISGT